MEEVDGNGLLYVAVIVQERGCCVNGVVSNAAPGSLYEGPQAAQSCPTDGQGKDTRLELEFG